MANPFQTFGITPDATDEQIRKRYLELTREFSPERHPGKFAEIRSAYEKIKDIEARVEFRLFGFETEDTIDSIIEEAACRTPRRRYGLNQLLSNLPPR